MPPKTSQLRANGEDRTPLVHRFRASLTQLLIAAAVALPLALPGTANAFGDENWPCQNRKVRHLSWGQMWAGPPLPESSRAWRDDEEVERLVRVLGARRTDMGQVKELVAELGPGDGKTREERLIALFAGVFAHIDRERATIVDGIERLARRERGRADRIEQMRDELEALKTGDKADEIETLDRIDVLEDEIKWDTRAYEDRRKSIQYVCESPVILEKRAFSLARIIQGELEGKG